MSGVIRAGVVGPQGPQGPQGPAGTPGTSGATGLQPGDVTYFARATAPTGFIKANGALISRATYADLFAAIGTVYGVGDGATTFALPDLRGEFPRGLDDGRGVDAGRAIGTAQADDFKAHNHGISGSGAASGSFGYVSGMESNSMSSTTGGTETRPRNIALLACLKY